MNSSEQGFGVVSEHRKLHDEFCRMIGAVYVSMGLQRLWLYLP